MIRKNQALLEEFACGQFEFNGMTRDIYKIGSDNQPSVLILQELPGITEHTLRFAQRLNADGYAVYLPLLFGEVGSAYEPLKNLARICIRREFVLMALNRPGPLTDWLRALSAHISSISQGQPIGVIGMCYTGGFVLSLMMEASIAAPVMSQPAKGMLLKRWKASLGVSDADLQASLTRSQRDNISILGLRFSNDIMCPAERFDTMERLFGERFIRVDIDSSLFNAHRISPLAHAVLTVDYNDAPGHPTRQAYETLLAFFHQRLGRQPDRPEMSSHIEQH